MSLNQQSRLKSPTNWSMIKNSRLPSLGTCVPLPVTLVSSRSTARVPLTIPVCPLVG
jgi:hypothetical protein